MKKNLLFLTAALFSGIAVNAQWVQQNTGFTAASRGITSISLVSSNVVWCSAYNGVTSTKPTHDFTRTINGGTTWLADSVKAIPAIPAEQQVANISAINGDTAWACLYSNAQTSVGGIYMTGNGGVTWAKQTTAAFTMTSFPDWVHFWDKNNGIAFGDPTATTFEVFTTSNGGTNWTAVPPANMPTLLTNEFGNANGFTVYGNTIWASTSLGRVVKSTDMGMHWTVATIKANAPVFTMSFRDVNNGLARVGTSNDTLMKTTDGGATWTRVIYTGRFLTAGLAYAGGATGAAYICTGSKTGKKGTSFSIDDGATWNMIDSTVQHTAVAFMNTTTGWTGSFNTSATVGGIYKWNWSGLAIGIAEHKNASELSVYPNPNNGQFQIALTNMGSKQTQISVYDLLGKQVYLKNEQTIGNGLMVQDIDLANCSKGIYIVQVRDGEKLFTNKIIVQ